MDNLENGSRFDIKQANQTKDYQYTVFDTYRMSLENPPKNYTLQKRIKTDSVTLFNRSTDPDLAELFMRIGTIFLCAFLPFLAVPITRRRQTIKIAALPHINLLIANFAGYFSSSYHQRFN